MSRQDCQSAHHGVRFPRVSGDEPFGRSEAPIERQFSPRERG